MCHLQTSKGENYEEKPKEEKQNRALCLLPAEYLLGQHSFLWSTPREVGNKSSGITKLECFSSVEMFRDILAVLPRLVDGVLEGGILNTVLSMSVLSRWTLYQHASDCRGSRQGGMKRAVVLQQEEVMVI